MPIGGGGGGSGLPSFITTDAVTKKTTFAGPVLIQPVTLPDNAVPALMVDAPPTAGTSSSVVRIQHDELPSDTTDILSIRRKTGPVQHFAVDSGGTVEVGIQATGSDGVVINDVAGNTVPIWAGNPDAGNHTAARHTICGAQTAPAVPASTVGLANPFDFACLVTVQGGTVSGVAVDGVGVGIGDGLVVVPRSSTITLTYAVAPTWKWFGLS